MTVPRSTRCDAHHALFIEEFEDEEIAHGRKIRQLLLETAVGGLTVAKKKNLRGNFSPECPFPPIYPLFDTCF
jgi:hypothetical protein